MKRWIVIVIALVIIVGAGALVNQTVVSQRWWKFISVYPTLRGNTEKGEGRIHR